MKTMSNVILALSVIALTAIPLIANAQHNDKETKEDVQRHRAMAAAHEAAAKCLESGKKEEVCMKALQSSCKGLAVGKYCGMKHAH
jgi:nucleoside-specific outer membrane channel protein Tsx